MPELDRRNFLKVLGVGAAGSTGCYRYSELPQKLIPYVVQPEEITPGIAVTYASTCQECSAGCGLHVRTREGRPVKLEGNPGHPINRGRLCARGQASIGRTYHPDRFRGPQRRNGQGELEPISWEEAQKLFSDELAAARGRLRVITGHTGPTLGALVDAFVKGVGGERLVYEPFAYESLRAAVKAVYGVEGRPRFDLDGADYVVDFGADSLESWISPTEHARQLADARDVHDHPDGGARLVYVGPRLSMTAGNADEWLPAKVGTEGILALGIARAALDAGHSGAADPALLRAVLRDFDAASVASRTGVPAETIQRLASELVAAKRPALLPPGVALTGRSATATTGAVLLLAAVVGAAGKTLVVPAEATPEAAPASFDDVLAFLRGVPQGAVLVVHGANPAYSLPSAAGFAEAVERAGFVVATASMPDETTDRADLILPDHTPLESWGDSEPRPGVRSIVQPTLRPLFDTQSVGDTLIAAAAALGSPISESGSFRGVLEAAWSGVDLRSALSRGGVFSDGAASRALTVAAGVSRLRFAEPELDGEGGHVLLPVPSPLLGDGRGANLPWLQETPDPVTKIAWQSWAEISHATAEKLGVGFSDVIAVETPAGRLEVPALPRGGIRDDVVAIATGQGHTVGRYASLGDDGERGEARGVNVVELLGPEVDESGGRAWLSSRASLRSAGRHRRIPLTQVTDNKRGRQLGEAVPLSALAAGAHDGEHAAEPAAHGAEAGEHGGGHGNGHGGAHEGPHEIRRPYDPADDSDPGSPYRWGMNIDLDRCTGCSACMVACAIENNIPQVGEVGLQRSRQMYWIRIERFVGDGEADLVPGRPFYRDREQLGVTDVRHSPMMCQQCGAAPCEPVCPVYATYHNPEGLNGMIYNRCIGTRYCANNCPYKARRFNWYDYQIENWPEPMRFMLNPDVTVRGQGVMEKCTFCVQRIKGAQQAAKDDGSWADGTLEVTPACAQTCPTDAIHFGNLKNPKSRVVQAEKAAAARSYRALHVLNTRPAVRYLAVVKRDEKDSGGHHA